MMTFSYSISAVILAREGSQRLPGKNSLPFGEFTLTSWAVTQCLHVDRISRVVLSTDIAEEQARFQRDPRVEVVARPQSLLGPQADSMACLRHALGDQASDWVFLVQPTSPWRTLDDYNQILDRCATWPSSWDGLLGATEDPSPPASLSLSPSDSKDSFCFQAEGRWRLNGAFYLLSQAFLRSRRSLREGNYAIHPMPIERSVDIDHQPDYLQASAGWRGHPDMALIR